MKLIQPLLFTLLAVLWVPACWSASYFPDRYDSKIEQAAEQFLPGVDWKLLKAQYYQESRLNPDAVSPVGAAGVAQFMPGTWYEISKQLGYENISPHMAGPAIKAGAYYMAKLRKGWSSPRPETDRHSLALASYNAGFGNLLKAQRLAGGVPDYFRISKRLPDVTGDYSRETLTYVTRIWGYWVKLSFVT